MQDTPRNIRSIVRKKNTITEEIYVLLNQASNDTDIISQAAEHYSKLGQWRESA